MDSKSEEVNDEDRIELPPDTIAILNEFLYKKHMQDSMESEEKEFEEDWQLSQFWYDKNTVCSLSKVCLKLIIERHQYQKPSQIAIALLCCPSLYKSVKAIHPNGIVRLLEFDTRFSAFGNDFEYYDYKDVKTNEILQNNYGNFFDILIIDPPFISKECIEHVSTLIHVIKKENSKIIMCSGQKAADWIKNYLLLNIQAFQPGHQRNLANEFSCYANFDFDNLL
ncbi:protein-lysine N-methyltransferase CG9154 [Contarinia nasturtii]|uniref:protein-lysine N-methyltransferase CG9154 n=1 Tax=Contarinia nasturtii TaxID=265458 RepID=UPI0012D47154|nr:protein-lysine N-methyltransferase CG9154 [Contarinia nasturtii]